jgi:hypothetical protein
MAHFQKDGLWVQGGLGALASVDEATPFVPGQLGRVMTVRTTDGKDPRFYQYVQRYTTEANTAAAGLVAYWADLDDFIVTADITDALGTTTSPVIAGVFLGAYPSAGQYGFIQVAGLATVAVTGTAEIGDVIVADTGTFNQVLSPGVVATDATVNLRLPQVGIALSAVGTSTDSSISAHLRCIRNGW